MKQLELDDRQITLIHLGLSCLGLECWKEEKNSPLGSSVPSKEVYELRSYIARFYQQRRENETT